MEKGNLNVIIFDEQQPKAIANKTQSRTVHTSKTNNLHENHQYDIIEQEIQYLAEKIRNLETQTENLNVFKNQSNVSQRQSTTTIEGGIERGTHCKQILIAIEKKIQIIVKQTRKIVDKLGQKFEKKLETKVSKKYEESGLSKMKDNYNSSLKKIEEYYKAQIDRVNKQYKEVQNKMIAKMNDAQQKLLNRINQFQIKEKEYVDWIHHLEIQLKEKQAKSKKMIEVTQDKVLSKLGTSENSSSIINNGQNNYSTINQQNRISPIQNDSKVHRKHRIFDNKGSSVSPQNKVAQSHFYASSVHTVNNGNSNNVFQSTKITNPAIRIKPAQYSEIESQATVSLATKMTEPLKNNIENQSSPWKVIDKSIEKSYGDTTKRNKVVENVKQDQFYKDIPKAYQGWDKFQDFKQNEASSSDSEEEIFYRSSDIRQEVFDRQKMNNHNGNDRKQLNFGRQSKKVNQGKAISSFQAKIFSPFDLN